MNPWILPWMRFLEGPFSGNVTQDIAPVTSWLSPQFEFNFAGSRRIESKIVSEVASYGRQLGVLSDAVLEIANGKKGEGVQRLEDLVKEIAEVKEHEASKMEQELEDRLDRLNKQDPDALERLLRKYASV